jgi:deaminated glutathione amidase
MRVALCQLNVGNDVARNVTKALESVERAAGEGADFVALPEVFVFQGSAAGIREAAEPVPGPTSEALSDAARRHGVWLLGGSLIESAGEHIYNTSLLFDRSGERVARYRKIHLFDVEIAGQPPLRESATYAAGTEIVTADTEFTRVGLSICYDVRFPELYRGLMARGAEILFVPSAFTHATGSAHWHTLLRARAIENQAFVVAPDQWGSWGPSEDRRRCYGHSLVIDAWGRIVAEAGDEGDEVVVADLDLGELRKVRTRLPALQHRRLGPAC